MTAAAAPDFNQVWTMFQETDRRMKETDRCMQETDRRMQETDRLFKELREDMKETDRLFQELREDMKVTDRRMKETDKKIGELGHRFGELAEHMVAPSIKEKFNALDFTFDKCSQHIDIADAQDEYSGAEIDILLENGDVAIAIEVKARALVKDIDRHLKRMEVPRRWADRHNDKRTFLGAVAGAIMPEEVRKYTLKAGFYVIEQTGDTVCINIPEGFSPREW
jgi:hypothetical protein